jgi:hypothetical protein
LGDHKPIAQDEPRGAFENRLDGVLNRGGKDAARDAGRDVSPLRVIPTADRGRPQAVLMVPREGVMPAKLPWAQPTPMTAVATGTAVGYPRREVEQCVARLRVLNPYALAAAILRSSPFADAPQLPVGTRNGVTYYTGVVLPWDMSRIEAINAPWSPGERAAYFIALARHYAAGLVDGNARPLNTSASWGDRILQSIPTHDRTAAWVDAWARWAVDAIAVALSDPSAYDTVAAAVMRICRG